MADDVPMDEDGKPMSKVHFHVGEKIGLPNYSNVDIGPASVERFVEDTPEAIEEGLRDATAAAEKILAEDRDKVLAAVRKAREAGAE